MHVPLPEQLLLLGAGQDFSRSSQILSLLQNELRQSSWEVQFSPFDFEDKRLPPLLLEIVESYYFTFLFYILVWVHEPDRKGLAEDTKPEKV